MHRAQGLHRPAGRRGPAVRLRRQPSTPGASRGPPAGAGRLAPLDPRRRRRPGRDRAGRRCGRARPPRRSCGSARTTSAASWPSPPGPDERLVRPSGSAGRPTGSARAGVDVQPRPEPPRRPTSWRPGPTSWPSPPAPRLAPGRAGRRPAARRDGHRGAPGGRALGRAVVVISEDDRPGAARRGRPPRRPTATRSRRPPVAGAVPLVGQYTIGAVSPGSTTPASSRRRWPASSPWSPAGSRSPTSTAAGLGRRRCRHRGAGLRRRPRRRAVPRVEALHPEVHLLGDAFAPRRMVFATRQAWSLAAELS